MKLFPGEEILFNESYDSINQKLSKDEIDKKYIRGDVRIVTEQARYPLNTITTMLKSGDYNLNPEFQRRKRWSVQKQSRLIESFIMNVPIPPIFLYEVEFSRYEVMDGLQRLTAINEFYDDCYQLVGLEQWPELNGMTYSKLPDQVRRGIDRRYLSSIILLQETARDESEATRLKQLVFERINSGGEKLEPQESRNALYNGKLNQLCISLARTESFCKMWGIPTETDFRKNPNLLQGSFDFDDDFPSDWDSDKELHTHVMYRKMQDVELVLRFFAYRQLKLAQPSTLVTFLDNYLNQGNQFSLEVLENLKTLFVDTSNLVYSVLGERAFYLLRKRKDRNWVWYERPTKVVYDPMMYAFSEFLSRKDVLINQKPKIREGLKDLYEKNVSTFEGRSTNQQDMFKRTNLFEQFLSLFC